MPEKDWYLSRGVVGSLATVIVGLAAAAGIVLDAGEVTEILLAVLTVASGALSLIGRWQARQQIKHPLRIEV